DAARVRSAARSPRDPVGLPRRAHARGHRGRRPRRGRGGAVGCTDAARSGPPRGVITAAPPIRHEVMLGRSERGRPIVAWETGDPEAKRRVLVVGCIHGNEPAGITVADAVLRARVPAGTDVWVVPDLNPDGVAAGTRQNARGVDLNRNF